MIVEEFPEKKEKSTTSKYIDAEMSLFLTFEYILPIKRGFENGLMVPRRFCFENRPIIIDIQKTKKLLNEMNYQMT